MNDPFSVVGQIISLMWQNSKCQNRQLDEHRPSLRNELNIFRLYYLPDCSNLKLYSTALDLLNSPITPFQVLPCTRITTQEALVLFFQRMKFMSNIRYILIDVNVLPVDLQEVNMHIMIIHSTQCVLYSTQCVLYILCIDHRLSLRNAVNYLNMPTVPTFSMTCISLKVNRH